MPSALRAIEFCNYKQSFSTTQNFEARMSTLVHFLISSLCFSNLLSMDTPLIDTGPEASPRILSHKPRATKIRQSSTGAHHRIGSLKPSSDTPSHAIMNQMHPQQRQASLAALSQRDTHGNPYLSAEITKSSPKNSMDNDGILKPLKQRSIKTHEMTEHQDNKDLSQEIVDIDIYSRHSTIPTDESLQPSFNAPPLVIKALSPKQGIIPELSQEPGASKDVRISVATPVAPRGSEPKHTSQSSIYSSFAEPRVLSPRNTAPQRNIGIISPKSNDQSNDYNHPSTATDQYSQKLPLSFNSANYEASDFKNNDLHPKVSNAFEILPLNPQMPESQDMEMTKEQQSLSFADKMRSLYNETVSKHEERMEYLAENSEKVAGGVFACCGSCCVAINSVGDE